MGVAPMPRPFISAAGSALLFCLLLLATAVRAAGA